MLNFFRKRDTFVRYLLGFFLVAVCLGMVAYLIPGFGSSSSYDQGSDTVATVDGRDIASFEFRTQLDRRLNQFQHGAEVPPGVMRMYGPQILNQIVMQQALADEARRLGFHATDAEVQDYMRQNLPMLFPNGQFIGQEQYEMFLQQQNFTAPQFEQQMRDTLLVSQLQDLVTDGVRVSPDEVQRNFRQQNEKAKFTYALLRPSDLEKDVSVTPAALQAYYEQNKNRYMTPERRSLEVVLADVGKFASKIQVADSDLQRAYQQNIASYSFPERVKAAHILLKTTGKTPQEIASIRQKAEDVLKKARSGADFAALAKQSSQDDATADKGGELSWIQRGQTVKAFEQAAFSLRPGQISDVIQTEYGFHIIKLEAHEQAHTRTLDDVRNDLTHTIQQQRALNDAQNAIERASGKAIRTPMQQVAKEEGLDYLSTPPLTRTDPVAGVGTSPEFMNAAFATREGGATPVLKVPQGFVIAKVAQIQPPRLQTLDEARVQVDRDYRRDKAVELARTRAQQLADAARREGIKAAAAAQHIALKTSDALTREGSLGDLGPINSFADELFSLKPGQAAGPAQLGNDEIVYSLVSLEEPPATDFQKQKDSLTDSMLQQKRQNVFQAYEDQLETRLKKSGKIKVNQTKLAEMLGGYGTENE